MRNAALSYVAFGPSSQTTFSFARPLIAEPVLRATTATPPTGMNFDGHGQPWTSTTFSTPGTFNASLGSNETSFPPTTGGRAITANFIPGIFASMP